MVHSMADQKADAKADSMDVPMAAQTADYLVAHWADYSAFHLADSMVVLMVPM